MSVVIFTGPTLPAEAAAALLPGGKILPPARQGDVWRAVRQYQPRAIGLIDGVFLHEPAVWHREILWALHQGIHVFGTASMGALRAVELSAYGMRGIGHVFEAYRNGVWSGFSDTFEDDDEVAVIHAPAGLGAAPLSDALVDLRDTLLAAEAAGLLDRERRDALFCAMKALPFPQRSFAVLADRAPELRAWLPAGRVPRKRLDAEAMLADLAAFLRTDPPPFVPQFRFEHVQAWHDFVRHETPMPGAEAALVLEELCLQPDDWRQAGIAALARLSARTKPSTADLRRARDRFRAREKLAQRADIDAWFADNALDEAELTRLMHDEAALDATLAVVPDAALIDHLRLTGQFSPLLRRAKAKQAALADCPPPTPGPELDAALAWFDHGNLSPLRITNGMAAAIWREYLFRRRFS